MCRKCGGILLSIVFVLSSTMVCAQDAADVTQKTQQVQTQEEQMSDIAQDGKVSLDFRDADIQNVLEILSYKSGINIVASPEVKGTVSVRLNQVQWQEALDVIVRTHGYAYEKRGNIIIVSTVESLKKRREDELVLADQESLETKTFILNFAKASDVVESIEKMKSDRGSIDFDDRTNTIIITDIESKTELIEMVIKKLDETTPQVSIETKIVETTLSDSENLGIDWTTQVTVSGAQRPITFPFETSGTNSRIYANDAFPGADTTTGSSNEDFTYGTLNFTQVQAVFEMLKTKTDTNILSNPRIVTLNNQKATIKVGEQYPIPNYTYNEERGQLLVSGWEYKDIGIIFDVTPHVNDAGFVTLDIEPTITAITSQVTFESTSLPLLSNESAKTSVIVKDGETLIIGGLIKNQTTDTKKKMPFLGDVPIVGLLFQKKEKTIAKTDLLIFLTPHIVTPDIPKE